MLNCDFLEKGLRIVSLSQEIFHEKIFLVLHSNNWPDIIASLPFLLEVFVNIHVAIACWPGCGIIDCEINLTFLIRQFFNMAENSRQRF